MLPVAILAGGFATRIKPISDSIPKSLIDIKGKPFLEWQLQLLEKNKCELVVICISHKSEMIEEFLHKRAKSQLKIRLSWDGQKQLGTGGALIKAMNLLGPAFMVLYGDSYIDIDYEEVANFFLKENRLALMTIMKNDVHAEISNVIYDNGLIKKYNKEKYEESMDYIDFGLNIFKAEAFINYPLNQEVDLSAIQSDLATQQQIVGFLVNHRYYEVGSYKGIQDFSEFIGGLK
jgi:MurNAc alpha-1-phosphate uridylyltransferase